MQGSEQEADRVVFLGWPGQNEPEEEALNASMDLAGFRGPSLSSALASSLHQDNLGSLNMGCGHGHMNAQLSQETADKMSNRPSGAKQLT